MSTYGIEVYRPDMSTKMDGLTKGGVFIEVLSIANGATGSKSYPRVPGAALYFYTAGAGGHRITIDSNPSGAGRINWTPTDSQTLNGSVLYVFATRLVVSDPYGIVVVNDGGEVLADHGYVTPQFIATVPLHTAAVRPTSRSTMDGYGAWVHQTDPITLRDSSDKIVLMALPDSGTNDTWYSIQNECIRAGAGSTVITVTVYTKASNYAIPSLHIYAVNNILPSSDSYGMRLQDASGAVTYDSGAEPVSVKDTLTVSYPGPNAAGNVYTLPSSGLLGLSLPYYYRSVQSSGANASKYMGVGRRVGNQLTLKLIYDDFNSDAATSGTYELGSQINRYLPIVDVSRLGASTPAGGGSTTGAPTISTSPSSVTAGANTTVTFSVVASGAGTLAYQWCHGDGTIINGATSANYSFVCSASDNGATFKCTVTNSVGSATSGMATLTVTGSPPAFTPVSITSNPSSTTVQNGTSASFSITVSGTSPVALQWYRGTTAISGATGFTYSFTATNADNGATFKCVATNGSGAYSATSDTATLTVTAGTPATNIYQAPASVSVAQGGSASMSCYATPDGLHYNWFENGNYIGVGNEMPCDTSTAGTFSYFCRVVNGTSGSVVDSPTATLTVTAAPQVPYSSYNNLSGSATLLDGQACEVDVYRDGSVYVAGQYIGTWANGSSTGTMYRVFGSGNFAPEPGSMDLGHSYFYSDYSDVYWIIPGGQYDGVNSTYTLNITVSLNSGGTVATISVTVKILSSH